MIVIFVECVESPWFSFSAFVYRLNYGDEMTQTLRHWRKRRFSIQEEKRLSEELELQGYISRLIREDRDRKVRIKLCT